MPECFGKRVVVRDREDRVAELLGRWIGGDQEAVVLVLDDRGHPLEFGADHGHAAGACLDEDVTVGFVPCGMDETGGSREDLLEHAVLVGIIQ